MALLKSIHASLVIFFLCHQVFAAKFWKEQKDAQFRMIRSPALTHDNISDIQPLQFPSNNSVQRAKRDDDFDDDDDRRGRGRDRKNYLDLRTLLTLLPYFIRAIVAQGAQPQPAGPGLGQLFG